MILFMTVCHSTCHPRAPGCQWGQRKEGKKKREKKKSCAILFPFIAFSEQKTMPHPKGKRKKKKKGKKEGGEKKNNHVAPV